MAALPVFIAVVFWAAVFMIFFTAQNITLGEFFFGRYETPPDLGEWKQVAPTSDEERELLAGLAREERLLLPNGRAGSRYLLRQTRYRDPVSRAIVRVEPEQRVRRRRISAR